MTSLLAPTAGRAVCPCRRVVAVADLLLATQVLRYSALGLGLFYGIYHQRSITATQQSEATKREYEHKKNLIDQAKAAYNKSKQPAAPSSSSGGRKSGTFLSVGFEPAAFLATYYG